MVEDAGEGPPVGAFLCRRRLLLAHSPVGRRRLPMGDPEGRAPPSWGFRNAAAGEKLARPPATAAARLLYCACRPSEEALEIVPGGLELETQRGLPDQLKLLGPGLLRERLAALFGAQLPADVARAGRGDGAGLERGSDAGAGAGSLGGGDGLFFFFSSVWGGGGGVLKQPLDHLEPRGEVEGEELPLVEELVGGRGDGFPLHGVGSHAEFEFPCMRRRTSGVTRECRRADVHVYVLFLLL